MLQPGKRNAGKVEKGQVEMIGRGISIGLAVLAASRVVCFAQTPLLGSIEAPYGSIQASVQVAGHSYGPGAVAYGPAGTPLVLSGSDLGDSGTVQFVSYYNAGTQQNPNEVTAGSVQATVTLWTPTMLIVTVPSGAYSGLVTVTTEGKTSNGLPFMVTPGSYVVAGSCTAGPPLTQLQINTSSLHDGAVNQPYSATLNATGGTQSYTWSIASGSALPAGLSLNASTGTISGTPTTAVSPASVTFAVTDNSNPHQTDQAMLDITIVPQQVNSGTVYGYCVPDPTAPAWCSSGSGFDGDGNVHQYQDTVMGTWNFQYDALNRLQSGGAVTGGSGSQDFTGQNLCWAYDSYGNRTAQSMQTAACPAPASESSLQSTVSYNASNRVTWVQNTAPSGFGYDAAGDVTYDGGNYYSYDAEGRVCAVQSYPASGGVLATGYLYDAEGTRVAKGSVTPSPSFPPQPLSCDPTQNGFQLTESYVLGPSGEELSMLDGNNKWQRTNVFAGGKLVGTYDMVTDPTASSPAQVPALHFQLTDPLGTRRMQLSGNPNPNQVGCPETDIQSWPYGDQLYSFTDPSGCATADDATPLHFTGKERDAESGNDYFGARYYASSMARFMSPDDGSDQFTSSPQSWNLYSYARNNPVTNTDADGNACVVQTRTSDTTESVSVASQGTCDGVSVGDGQSATYVNGNVNLSDIHAGADGHSVDIGFTSYDGQSSGVQNSGGAPMPDNPGLAYGFGNNAQGYQTLGAASTVVQDATIAVGATYGALGVAAFASGGGGAAVALRLAQMGRVAAATLAGGWKVGQQMARTGAGSPAALLDYAKTAMTNAVQAGTYVQTQFGTIYRDGGNYVVQNFQGAISSVVVNAEAGRGIVTEYLSRGGK